MFSINGPNWIKHLYIIFQMVLSQLIVYSACTGWHLTVKKSFSFSCVHLFCWSFIQLLICHIDSWFSFCSINQIEFPGCTIGKEHTCNAEDWIRLGFDPWFGKILCRRAWKPTLIFLLENSMDGGFWQATVCRIPKSQTWLKQLSMHAYK